MFFALTHLRAKDLGVGLDLEEELEALGRASSGLRGAIYDLRREKAYSPIIGQGVFLEVHHA